MSVLAVCVLHTSAKIAEKRITFAKCGLKHPNILHIPQKEREKDSDRGERKPVVAVYSTPGSSGLTRAADHDCKLSIVPVQVKSHKGSKIVTTYAFLDSGSTAVFCTEDFMYELGHTG